MKKQILSLAFGLLSITTISQQTDDKQLTAQFDKLLAEQFKPNEPGATALVSRNGQVIYKKAFGMANLELDVPMKVENVFRIGSITKQFTAVAILQLMEQGKLNLQDEITKFIPDYPTQGTKITIEHLLTHTSGIRNYSGLPDTAKKLAGEVSTKDILDFFKNMPMRFAPGTKWEYNNSGYFLLGYIIEKISGKSYGEYLQENIFKPAGMTNSQFSSDTRIIKNRIDGYVAGEMGFQNAPYTNMFIPFSAGSILSTVEDMFKWQQALLTSKLIKKENLDKAWTKYKLSDGQEANYGYGWRQGNVYEYASIWHGGLITGFRTMQVYLPKEDVFVVIFSNCENNSPEFITSRFAALAAGKPTEYKEISVTPAALQEYAGVYENLRGQQRIITISENKLYSQIGRGPKSQLKAYQKDMFFFDPVVTIEYSRNQKGQIEKLTSKNVTGNDVWTKTNKPIPSQDGIKVDEKILATYVGEYELQPEMSFTITRDQNKLFVQAPRQEKLEMFAETETKFFLKVNDAEFEFMKDATGKVTKIAFSQSGRKMEAQKIK